MVFQYKNILHPVIHDGMETRAEKYN